MMCRKGLATTKKHLIYAQARYRDQGSTACSDPAQAELLAAAGQRLAAGPLRISVKIQI